MLDYIKSDLCRYVGYKNVNTLNFIKHYFFNSGFKFSVWHRLGKSRYKPIRILAKIRTKTIGRKYFLDIPVETEIGYGLYIGHGQCIVINPTAKIGNNVNLSQFTTIGANHGQAAVIGDNVYIAPNVCIVENITIGQEVKIGAGAVVIKDVPNHSVVAGVPARIINTCPENNYVNNRWPHIG